MRAKVVGRVWLALLILFVACGVRSLLSMPNGVFPHGDPLYMIGDGAIMLGFFLAFMIAPFAIIAAVCLFNLTLVAFFKWTFTGKWDFDS